MSQHKTLEAQKREGAGTQIAKKLRRQGILPAVVYGAHQRTYPIQVNEIAFRDVLKGSATENILVDLRIEGAVEKVKLALVQAVQRDCLTGSVLHIDFNAVNENEPIHAKVGIELTGTSKGVKAGGVLDQQIHEIEITCLPNDLPDMIHIDIAHLGIDDAVHISDVTFPKGVTPLMEESVIIAIVSEPSALKSEDDETEAAAATGDAASTEAADEDGEKADGDDDK